MGKFVTKIALVLCVVFGAVSIVNAVELYDSDKEVIDELKVRYEEFKKNTGEKLDEVEKFFAFVDFYKTYEAERFDGYKAWKAAIKENGKYKRRGEYSKTPYWLCGENSNNFSFSYCVDWLFKRMSERELALEVIRPN